MYVALQKFTAIIDGEEKFFDVGDTMTSDEEEATDAKEKGLVKPMKTKKAK